MCSLSVRVKLGQCIISVNTSNNAVEYLVTNHLAQLNTLLGLALTFHFLLVELGERLGRVWHGLICHENNTRMLHFADLFSREAIFVRILREGINVCTICSIDSCQFSSHCSPIPTQNNTFGANYNWAL